MNALPIRLAIVLTTALATTSACASPDPEPVASASVTASASVSGSPTAGPTASVAPSTGGGTIPDDLRTRPEVAAAIADTASRANVPPEQVLIAAWSPVTWNDG